MMPMEVLYLSCKSIVSASATHYVTPGIGMTSANGKQIRLCIATVVPDKPTPPLTRSMPAHGQSKIISLEKP
jgi:hypothetical protein